MHAVSLSGSKLGMQRAPIPRSGLVILFHADLQEVRMMVRRMAAMAGGGHDVDPGSDSEAEIFDGLYDSYGLQQADAREARMQPYIE